MVEVTTAVEPITNGALRSITLPTAHRIVASTVPVPVRGAFSVHSAVFGEGTVTTLFRFKLEIVVDPITKETFLSKTCPMGALIDKRAEEPVKDDFRVPNELGKLSEDTVVRSTFLILLGPMTNGFPMWGFGYPLE